MQKSAGQTVALQLADGLPMTAIIRCLATQLIPLGGHFVIIGHHAAHLDFPGRDIEGSTPVILQPCVISHEDISGIRPTVDGPFGLPSWQLPFGCGHFQCGRLGIVADAIGHQVCRVVVVYC